MAAKRPSAAVQRGLPHAATAGQVYLFLCYAPTCTDHHSVTAARAEAAFLDWLRVQARDAEASVAMKIADRASRATATVDRRHLERTQQGIADRMMSAVRDHNSGLYDDETFMALRDELTRSRAAINRQLDELAGQLERPKPTPQVFRQLLASWSNGDLDNQAKQLAVRNIGVTLTVSRQEGKRGRGSAVVTCKGGWQIDPTVETPGR